MLIQQLKLTPKITNLYSVNVAIFNELGSLLAISDNIEQSPNATIVHNLQVACSGAYAKYDQRTLELEIVRELRDSGYEQESLVPN